MQRTPKDKQKQGHPDPLQRDDQQNREIRHVPNREKNPFAPDRRSDEDDSEPTIGGGGTGGRDW